MAFVNECLIEVEAFEGNDSLGTDRRKAFVKAYVPQAHESEIEQILRDKCDFMGFTLIRIIQIKNVTETDIPQEALENYRRFDAGFGTFHSFPPP
ncbi:MAG TPA: hypothetical protein VMF08_14140 [Candidatus Sulfotelmatobacter sp.]|nr:hypothetical protein [Candidatus Sulfotelmatobacter sp.]